MSSPRGIRRSFSDDMRTDDDRSVDELVSQEIPLNEQNNFIYESFIDENNPVTENQTQPSTLDLMSMMNELKGMFVDVHSKLHIIETNQEHADRKSNRIENRLRHSLEANILQQDNQVLGNRTARFEFPEFEPQGSNSHNGNSNQARIPTTGSEYEDPYYNPHSSPHRETGERMRDHIRDRVQANTVRRRNVPEEATNESIHEINIDHVLGEDINPFERATMNRNGRRMTISAIPSVIPGVATANNNAATVVVTPFEVKDIDKMKYISLKSIKRLMEHYAVFKASSLDNTKTLIFFISTECQHKLINNQLVLGTELSERINPQNIFRVKDEHVENMLSDFIRPTSRDDFVFMFNQAMTHPRWRKDLEFSTLNYHKDIFPHVTLFLEECEIYNEYLRRGATPYEQDFMPKMEWGKKDPGGMLRIAMAILHPYQDNFIQLLQEEKLNKITSMKEFIRIFKYKNREISQISLEILRQNDKMKKPTAYATIAAQARKKSDEYKEYKDKVAKTGSATTSRRSSTYTKYNKSRGTLNEMEGINDVIPENENEDEFYIDPRALESDDEDDNLGMTEEEWNQRYEENQRHQERVAKEIRNWDDSEVHLALDALCAIEPNYTPRRNHDGVKIYKAKPVNTKEQVCFQYAFGKCTAGNACVYSHDLSKVKGFLKTSYERLVGAPAWDPKILTEVATTKTSSRGGYDSQNSFKSNHGGSHGSKGAAQSPAADQRKPPFANNYGKSYIIEVEKPIGNTEKKSNDLPSAVIDQPYSAEKSASSRVLLATGTRDEADL